jgi:GT2 family glycosyltransferase
MKDYQPRMLDTCAISPRTLLDDITVVIPTLGRPILEESLYWITAGTVWPKGIIVVDQGDNEQVANWIERLRNLGIDAEHMPSSKRGRAAGINSGLEQVKTRFVAITDDDCFVAGDWLENLSAQLRSNPDTIVAGRVEAAGDDVILVVTSRKPAIYHRPRLKFDTMSGGNVGTAMAVIKRVGLLDEDPCMRTAEDGEWAYRALRANTPIIYAPEVVVYHFGWRSEEERALQYRNYARSQGGFYGKYLRKGDWFIGLRAIMHHYRALRRWIRGLKSGDQEAVLCGRAYFTGLLPGIIAGFRSEKTS